MSKYHKIYSPSADWTVNAHINSLDKYKEIYNKSIEDPDVFWSDIATVSYTHLTLPTILLV